MLANTRASAETPEGRSNRLAAAERVLRQGTAEFVAEMVPKLFSPMTLTNRPDLVERARRMMLKMSPQDVSAVQRGLAERPDSITTLNTITVPTLIIGAEDDSIPRAEFELMRQQIQNCRLHVLARAGHYAAMEQPEEFAGLLRSFLDALPRG